MIGVQVKPKTNIALPLSFIIFALISFATAQMIILFQTDLFIISNFRVPSIWMAAHLLLVGFAVMVAMGAMYQLVPVAFLTPIWNESFGFYQLVVTVVGISSLSLLLGFYPEKAFYGATIAVIGILMFILQMVITIAKQKNKTIITIFILSALLCFLLTVIAGCFLAWNISFDYLFPHDAILYSHISFGINGWFSLLIFGFSYKLVPMFSLSHGFSMKWAKISFSTYIIGQVLFIVSFWLRIPFIQTIAWLFLFSGFLLFALDMWEILKKRLRRKLDKPFSFSLFAICIGFFIHLVVLIVHIIGLDDPRLWSWLIFLYIVGWIIFSILGYLYKIVPFLWWTYKYSDRIGKEKVPTMTEMINEKICVILFSLFILSMGGLIFGVILQNSILIFIFQAILTVTTLGYVISIIKVLFA